jgi:hypothetical protein
MNRRVDRTLWAQAARTCAGVYAVRLALCLPMALLFAAAAAAQTPQPARPNRGLFGPQDDTSTRRRAIDFTMSLNEGYDKNIDDQQTEISVPVRHTGMYSKLDAGLRYARGRRQRRLTATAGSAVRYESGMHQFLSANYQGGLALTFPAWRGASVDVSQGAAYTSYYQLELFPALPIDAAQMPQVPSTDFAVWKQPAYTYTSRFDFAQQLGRRSALSLQYDRRSVAFGGSGADLLSQGMAFKFTHHLTRYVGFHAVVGTHAALQGRSSAAHPTRTDNIDIGLDYGRPLSISRRTTLSFSSGSALIPEGGRRHYRVTGEASLRHEIGRTWIASLEYRRGVQFVEAFPRPFFSDSIATGLRGRPKRRVEFAGLGGYSTGAIGLSGEGGVYGTYTGSMQVSIAMTRHWAISSEYLFYHYRFGRQLLAEAFPNLLDRQTARVGLTLWLPTR